MAIRTIIFDFGGVLYKMPNPKKINRWLGLLGLSGDAEVLEILANPSESAFMKDIFLGKTSEKEAWALMHNRWRIKPEIIRRFRNHFLSKRYLNRPLVRLMADLHQQFRLGILSNAGDQTRSLMTDILHLDRYVDEIIISAEEGLIKPDPRIFQIAMLRLETKPEQTLFIDDTLENIKAAEGLGMKAIQFIDNQQINQMIDHLIREEG